MCKYLAHLILYHKVVFSFYPVKSEKIFTLAKGDGSECHLNPKVTFRTVPFGTSDIIKV